MGNAVNLQIIFNFLKISKKKLSNTYVKHFRWINQDILNIISKSMHRSQSHTFLRGKNLTTVRGGKSVDSDDWP